MASRFIRIVVKFTIFVAILFGVAFLLTQNREAKALSFLGSGTIVESQTKMFGFDSFHWARINCNPQVVRKFIKTHHFPSETPDSEMPRRAQDEFKYFPLKWPGNFNDYTSEWIKFEVGQGRYTIVVFNDKGAGEVLYIHWND
jgi:hypothetical protein